MANGNYKGLGRCVLVEPTITYSETSEQNLQFSVIGNGVVFPFISIYTTNNEVGRYNAQIWKNTQQSQTRIAAQGTISQITSDSSSSGSIMGVDICAPVEVVDGDIIKFQYYYNISQSKTTRIRFLCFGCTVVQE